MLFFLCNLISDINNIIYYIFIRNSIFQIYRIFISSFILHIYATFKCRISTLFIAPLKPYYYPIIPPLKPYYYPIIPPLNYSESQFPQFFSFFYKMLRKRHLPHRFFHSLYPRRINHTLLLCDYALLSLNLP